MGHAEQMTAILRRIGGALIEATPERWTEVTLRVEVRTTAEGTTITHSVKSEQHPRDIVLGTDELFEATRELQLLSNRAGEPWAAFVMRVRQQDGDWKFDIKFEYPDIT